MTNRATPMGSVALFASVVLSLAPITITWTALLNSISMRKRINVSSSGGIRWALAFLALIALSGQIALGQAIKGGPLKLPYESSAADSGTLFSVISSNAQGTAIHGTGFIGVAGYSTKVNGTGVGGQAFGVKGNGVYGTGKNGADGVYGRSDTGAGVEAKSDSGPAVVANSVSAPGISATSETANAVVGKSDSGNGVEGESKNNIGIRGVSEGENGKGVAGKGYVGIYGEGKIAGFFNGQTTVHGVLLVNKIDAEEIYGGKKLFRIDHPLDPPRKLLSHSSVESNEMKNVYDGTIALDSDGVGRVSLPEWFQALNKDFRYQLTCIGGYAPVYIAREIANNSFEIAGGTPGLKVSWQVTGIRQDAYAKAHPLRVEEEKAPAEQGRYVHPVEFGVPDSMAIGYVHVSPVIDNQAQDRLAQALGNTVSEAVSNELVGTDARLARPCDRRE